MRSDRSVTPKERINVGDAEDAELCRGLSLSCLNVTERCESELMARRTPVQDLSVLCASASHALKYLLASRRPRRGAVFDSVPRGGIVHHGSETSPFVFKGMFSGRPLESLWNHLIEK